MLWLSSYAVLWSATLLMRHPSAQAFAPRVTHTQSRMQLARAAAAFRSTGLKEQATSTDGASTQSASSIPSPSFFFATTTATTDSPTTTSKLEALSRALGSQELLMLPRQYGPSKETFPSMNHVMVATLNKTPPLPLLRRAIRAIQRAHPLLRARVEGTGEPTKRIDLFQMVREGEPDPLRFVADDRSEQVLQDESCAELLTVVKVPSADMLEESWKKAFVRDLDDGSWCQVNKGPLWKLELHTTERADGPCALVFSFNHAISDQSSANRILNQLLQLVSSMESSTMAVAPKTQSMPVTLEESVLGRDQQWSRAGMSGASIGTLQYVVGKAAEGLKNPVMVRDQKEMQSTNSLVGSLSLISGQAAGGVDDAMDSRQSSVQFRKLSSETTTALLEACRKQGVAVTHALAAAVTLTASDFVGSGSSQASIKKRNYKVLESLDMRRFGAKLDSGETVACMAGSMDLSFDGIEDRSGERLRRDPGPQQLDLLWNMARDGKVQTSGFIDSEGPGQAVRVFDFAMTISDLTNLVNLSSKSKSTQGRAYSAGVTNVGVFDRQEAFQLSEEPGRSAMTTKHGQYEIEDIYFATPHTNSGCLFPVSCLTVNGELQITFHPVAPLVDDSTSGKFADAFVELLNIAAYGGQESRRHLDESTAAENMQAFRLPQNTLVGVTTIVGILAVASHGQAWIDFFRSVIEMKNNTPDPSDFWAALNFWIFFAVGHPLLQPILWISDVLHGTPGFRVGGLIPVLFAVGNVLILWAIFASKQLRDAVNVALIAGFFTYVGAGLDGQAGLGDFNLALDDSYRGQVVKGCPAYEDVKQPSMEKFDLQKYQGLWYEAKFHDWTQFKEVYDTTLNIRLTDDGKGWVDDFGVKGPAPDAAPLSWDKSPVANGAHYFLFGRVDPSDPPGVLREKGFGVEFPNYIVDVQTDPETGEYKEAIQFQCLERGGVRVFEGINFMSRNPTMSDAELEAMHLRAEKAGMYPYGASPEQMHNVARKLDRTPIENNWQAMWQAIGLDRLLELLTESIEDGGRSSDVAQP